MKRYKNKKREKFSWILTKSLAVALVLSCVFAIGFQIFIDESARNQLDWQLSNDMSDIQEEISERTDVCEPEYLMNDISSNMAFYTGYNVCFDQFGLFDPNNERSVQIVPEYSEGCHVAAALTDKDGNIVASSRQRIYAFLLFEKDKENDKDRGSYFCELDTLDPSLAEEFAGMNSQNDMLNLITVSADSMYINKKDHRFIPHKGRFTITTYRKKGFFGDDNDYYLSDDRIEKEETKEFTIDINDLDIESSDYELTTVYKGISGEENEYPRYAYMIALGTDREVFDSFNDEFSRTQSIASHSFHGNDDDTVTFDRNRTVTINGELYTLYLRYIFNFKEPTLVRYYWSYTILVAALLLLITVLYAWRRNVKNKARYAMEDFQRDLTNDLAHDIKTPLTAIGGYAENILDGDLTDAEKERYLRSILDNVAFTDSMISRTLQLNKMDGTEKLRRESVNVSELLEASVNKYEILLDEKNIRFSSDGSATVKADRAALEVIIENLVSNAVKYTSENGSVKAECSEKGIVITNSVAQKVDVKALTQPFVRGDQARSNTEGSGLGLALADRAAQTAGMALKLSCSDTEFRAELKF